MENMRINLAAVGVLVVVLAVLIGSAIAAPAFLVLLATILAWANLTYLVYLSMQR